TIDPDNDTKQIKLTTSAQQIGAIASINTTVTPDSNGNINLVAGNKNITITPNANTIKISATGGLGLETDLTTLNAGNWTHGATMTLSQFMDGLQVNFSGESLPINLGTTPGEVFLVAAKIPIDLRQSLDNPFNTYHYEYLPGNVVLENDGIASFKFREEDLKPIQAYLEQILKLEQQSGRTSLIILVQLKCDFIMDTNGKAVDGHHIGGTGQSGIKLDGQPYGLQGGLFESWFYLTEFITVDRTRSNDIANAIRENPDINITGLRSMLGVGLRPELDRLVDEGRIRRDSGRRYTVVS
ncbi:hypothetical protein IH992_34965, partial [Candidatus Poribacteria bacterium]|nr:hypothetical protein [Candidatus Poribacteria bacterium]